MNTNGNHVNGISKINENARDTSTWKVHASKTARNTVNPIRSLVDEMQIRPNPEKKLITLSLGDPTVFGNFQPHDKVIQSVVDVLKSGQCNGYGPSFGLNTARAAVAKYVSRQGAEVSASDVYLSCGCSDAISLAITVLADPGDNILVPRPGFSLYKTLAVSQGIQVKHYDCLPERSWEIDLEHMESIIDGNTKAIVIVNPSNPCGSNFSEEHIKDILQISEKFKVPILADEIYADIVFGGQKFTSVASQTSTVPVLSCGGIAKRFLVPGWRIGWVVVHDRNNVLGKEIRSGLLKLTQRILGPATIIQAALPGILDTPDSFHRGVIEKLQRSADILFTRLSGIPGLKPIKPQAAMYMMVGIDRQHLPDFENDLAFTERLVSEQSVFCLPAQCFEYPNYFRLVLTLPEASMIEACDRIEEFCKKHYRK